MPRYAHRCSADPGLQNGVGSKRRGTKITVALALVSARRRHGIEHWQPSSAAFPRHAQRPNPRRGLLRVKRAAPGDALTMRRVLADQYSHTVFATQDRSRRSEAEDHED
jgi:hypothetical protein